MGGNSGPLCAGNREEMHSEGHAASLSEVGDSFPPTTKKGQAALLPPLLNVGWSFCPIKSGKKKKEVETRSQGVHSTITADNRTPDQLKINCFHPSQGTI